ncbi:MAG TPA: FGGY-family carbohydrate kinase [Patescibacteria group bacterium]|nr:FGGY-family carbohydrate kinase [Patescibacteria group bacterium]
MTDLLLGVDIGTASSKGVLVRLDGGIVATTQRPHQLSLPRAGWAEHDAEAVWWADFVSIARELAAHEGGRIAAVGVSGIGPAVLPVDGSGRALRPAILYGIDTRAGREIEELTDRYGAAAILARGGTLLTSQAGGPKLVWIRRHEPDVWAATRRFHMAHSLVVERLTGEYVLDHHSASQCDPLYDMRAGSWAADWAADIVPGLELPQLAWSNEVVGRVHAAAAALTGIPEGTPVIAGTIDAWAEALSAGVRDPGDTMLMYGTTMFIVEVARSFRPETGLWSTQGMFEGTSSYAAGLSTSGGLTVWLRDIVGQDFETLIGEAAATPPGAGGLVVLPYFGVARSPIFDPGARGAIFGLTLSHGRGHLYRALLEGTAYEVRHNLEVMADAGAGSDQLTAVGGGTKSELWTQLVSDVTGLPQVVPTITIGASYGDAMLAGDGAGLVADSRAWNAPARTLQPDPRARAGYDDLYRVYRSLYPATSDLAHAIARLQEGAPPAG